jgi:hypothetical protein
MSALVKRCAGQCRTVRGNTAFARRKGGGRETVCRFCRSLELAADRAKRVSERAAIGRRIRQLRRLERHLAKRIEVHAAERRALMRRIGRREVAAQLKMAS